MKSVFITGTDTGIGKTYVSCLILEKLQALGFKTVAMKPIATGGVELNGHLVNEDVALLQQATSEHESYVTINPINFKMPVSPNIAAKFEHKSLKKAEVLELIKTSVHVEADYRIIEGAGGWMVPLGEDFLLSDIVQGLSIPVILVVGLKLGCLNHSLLTANLMQAQGIPLIGWVANCIDPAMLALKENIQTLCKWIPAPCLGVINYGGRGELDLKPML